MIFNDKLVKNSICYPILDFNVYFKKQCFSWFNLISQFFKIKFHINSECTCKTNQLKMEHDLLFSCLKEQKLLSKTPLIIWKHDRVCT